ncbi:MAG: transporter substrate-binding domain-containing protein, partial [Thermodesulfobacteriota bacterium]
MSKSANLQHIRRTSRIALAVIGACLAVLLFKAVFPVQAGTPFRELRSGWYPHEPYQMEEGPGAGTEITGLDIQISRELFAQSGHRVTFDPMSWAESLEGLRTGETDFLMGAYYDKSREEFAYYSKPYRTERNDIYYHKKERIMPGKQKAQFMEEAHEYFALAQKLRPEGVTNYYRQAMLYKNLQDKDLKATPLFRQAIENWEAYDQALREQRHQEYKNYVKSLYNLASCLLKQDKATQALQLLNKCLEQDRDPGVTDARVTVATVIPANGAQAAAGEA